MAVEWEAMMGRLKRNQGQFFYSFCLDEVVPDDHRVSEIAGVLDLSWVHAECRSRRIGSVGQRSAVSCFAFEKSDDGLLVRSHFGG
jgi:hypothetical protein